MRRLQEPRSLQLGKEYYTYVIPSVTTVVLGGFYTIIDGIFIGQATGDVGLAAINIAWPFMTLILATGTGIGTGGAALFSIRRGSEDKEGAASVRGDTLSLLLVSVILIMGLLFIFQRPLLKVLGAGDDPLLMDMAVDYTTVVVGGCFFQIFGLGLSPLLRNDSKPRLAMIIMVSGLITNIVLDYLFIMVMGWGLTGAAIATVCSQMVTALPCFINLASENSFVGRLRFRDMRLKSLEVKGILTTGISPFGTAITYGLIIILNNYATLKFGGTAGLAAYSVMLYVIHPIINFQSGIGDGIQPLVSKAYGAGDGMVMGWNLKKALGHSIAFGCLVILLLLPSRRAVSSFFGASELVSTYISQGFFYVAFAFPLTGLIRVMTAFMYATGKSLRASVIIYGDAFITTPLMLVILPRFFGLSGVWMAYTASQLLLTVLTAALWRRRER